MKVEIQPQETENTKMVSSIVNDLLDKLYGKKEPEYKPKVINFIVQPDPNMLRKQMVGVSRSSKVDHMPNILDTGNHGSKRKPPRSRYTNKQDIDSTLSAESINTDILGALGGRNGGTRSIRRLTKKPLIGQSLTTEPNTASASENQYGANVKHTIDDSHKDETFWDDLIDTNRRG